LHYTKEQIDEANHKSIAGYLETRGEVLKRVGGEWLWEKNQVWIRGCEWYTHYDCRGGHAVSFVMKYFGLSFQDAVAELLGNGCSAQSCVKTREKEVRELAVPVSNKTMNRVYAYLLEERCIDREVVLFFAHGKLLYEDCQYHNCVFVGKDESGAIKHIHRRGTNSQSSFKQTEAGSDKEYAFHYTGTSEWLFVFEAPIDLMAFISLHKSTWRKHSYVALCCVAEHAMLHQLSANPHLRKVVLCLDHDDAGTKATERLTKILRSQGYSNVRVMLPANKDWDEDLKAQYHKPAIPASITISSENIAALCRELCEEAQSAKKPVQLYAALKDAYETLRKTPKQCLQEQCRKLAVLLFLFAKDECRKSEADMDWLVLCGKIAESYALYADSGTLPVRMKQLQADMKSLFDFYDTGSRMPVGNADAVLKNIAPCLMDCVRLLNFLKGGKR